MLVLHGSSQPGPGASATKLGLRDVKPERQLAAAGSGSDRPGGRSLGTRDTGRLGSFLLELVTAGQSQLCAMAKHHLSPHDDRFMATALIWTANISSECAWVGVGWEGRKAGSTKIASGAE